jgi:FeS assembly protein SufD
MTHASAVAFVADFERVAPSLPGAGTPWLARCRRDALERFAASGIPTRREEAWKHTSLAALEKAAFTARTNGSERPVTPAELDALAFDGLECHRLVFVDGRYAPALSRHGTLPPGATLRTLGEMLADSPAAAERASIEHYRMQEEGPRALHIGAVHAIQGRASRLHSHSIALGAALARADITTSFDAEACDATLDGLYVAGGRQHVDHHTRIDHASPHGTSREHYRGLLDGTARGVFNGKVVVHAGAQKTDARQANHNLLLSRDAEVDTKPQLEIYADDVKCTHGATVGQLDAQQLFYLRSRGIEESAARGLLTHAFARTVIDRMRLAPVRARLERMLFSRAPEARLAVEPA